MNEEKVLGGSNCLGDILPGGGEIEVRCELTNADWRKLDRAIAESGAVACSENSLHEPLASMG